MRPPLACVIAAMLVLAVSPPVRGIEPEKVEAVVWALQSYAVTEYATVYSPPQARVIHLVAEAQNAVDPRTTLVYYWPLTREYFQSWETLDEEVDGSLEILTRGRVVQRIERTPVVFSYPRASAEGASVLLSGTDAEEATAAYSIATRRYEAEMADYALATLNYQNELREYLRRTSEGAAAPAGLHPPKEPSPPEPVPWFVTDPRWMFVVALAEGRYEARVVDVHGDVVEGSERTIVAFSPTERDGVGYQVIPEERWTARMQSDTPADVLYCAPGKEIFVIPSVSETYRADDLARLRNPQVGDASEGFQPVYVRPLDARTLVIRRDDAKVRTVDVRPWFVRQAPGAELGYSIVEWSKETAGGDGPTFEAFRLRFEAAEAGACYSLGVEDPSTGEPVRGSERSIRVVHAGPPGLLWLLVLIPLAVGATVIMVRLRKT